MSPLKEVGKQIAKSLVRGLGEAPMPAKPFYSPLDKAISEITQNKGTGQQIEQILKKTKGVSKELKDRPVIQELLKQPKVTKEQLTKAAAEHPAAQVMEKVEKGPADIRHRIEHDELNDRFDVVDDYSNVVKSFRDYDDAEDYLKELRHGTSQYEKYQLPGGKNYREIKLMIPSYRPSIKNMGRAEYNEAIAKADREGVSDFVSTHFDEPNILAHARVSDRVGPNGEKILHVEEIQSDWHQAGRKKRYKQEFQPNIPEITGKQMTVDEFVKTQGQDGLEWIELKNSINKHIGLPELGGSDQVNVLLENNNPVMIRGASEGPMNDMIEARKRGLHAINRQAQKDFEAKQSQAVPDAPFKQNWHELAMKRLLDDAVKKGYDKVVITPGAEQAKRYDLSKHFGEISYKHNEDGTISIIGTDKKSGLANLHEEDIQKDKLPEYVGKELAEKIMANVGTPYEGTSRMRQGSMTLSNLDLKVGGEGMEGFYDKMLPSFLNEYGKKWGASVGQHELSVPRKQPISSIQDAIDQGLVSKDEVLAMDQAQRNALMDSFRNENIPVHSFDITPQMREEITGKGQPLYQMIPAGVGAGTLAAPQEEVPEQPMKRGGAVSMDAMRLAVMNKQLRK